MNSEDTHSHPRWEKLAPRLRDLPGDDLPTDVPLGFATRVVAQANLTPRVSPLARLRNWSIFIAGASACALIVTLTLHEPAQQFLPLPEPEFPTPTSR
ncbi:hypothetical protein V2O64_08960 [Verrucomicrobiaceae bacterium 227]